MKRSLITSTFLVTLGMALAGPPADVPLVCGEGGDAAVVGVASFAENHLHLTLLDGALATCTDGVFGVAGGATVLIVSYALEDGVLTDVHVAIAADPDSTPSLTYAEVPAVAVEGMLAAERNRAAALERADRAADHTGDPADGPPTNAPGEGDRDRTQDQDHDQDRDRDGDRARDQDGDACQDGCDREAFGGAPADRPAPGTPRHP